MRCTFCKSVAFSYFRGRILCAKPLYFHFWGRILCANTLPFFYFRDMDLCANPLQFLIVGVGFFVQFLCIYILGRIFVQFLCISFPLLCFLDFPFTSFRLLNAAHRHGSACSSKDFTPFVFFNPPPGPLQCKDVFIFISVLHFPSSQASTFHCSLYFSFTFLLSCSVCSARKCKSQMHHKGFHPKTMIL